PTWRPAGRVARRAAHHVRASDQPQDGQSPRPDHSPVAAGAGGRDHQMIDRRTFIATSGIAILTAPLAAEAQQPGKVPRIGYLGLNRAAYPDLVEAFLQGLRDLGYVEGRNVVIEYRDAEGKSERLPALAADLVALKVDVIVTENSTLAARVAKQATTTIPIVFTSVGDPVESGLVTSL